MGINVNHAANMIGKTMLVAETVKAVLFAIVFMGIGAGIEYWALTYAPYEEGTKLAGISIGALFFVVGLFIAVAQTFTWNRIMKGPPGTAAAWYKNHQRQQAIAAAHAMSTQRARPIRRRQ